jgi:hypothetical protein
MAIFKSAARIVVGIALVLAAPSLLMADSAESPTPC